MRGGYSFTSVKKLDNDYALVASGNKKWHYMDLQVQEYKVPISVLEELRVVYDKHKLGRFARAPKSPFVVLDGDTSSYSFNFAKESVDFSSRQILPASAHEGLKEIFKVVSVNCAKGEKLPGLVLENSNDDFKHSSKFIHKDKLLLKISSYQGRSLELVFLNGLTEKQTINLSYKLTKFDEGNKLAEEKLSQNKFSVRPNSCQEYTLELKERLQAGQYILQIGDLQTKFTMQ